MSLYENMQLRLSDFVVEQITTDNFEKYEEIFYCNKEYYVLTDGQAATKETIIETIEYCPNDFPKENAQILHILSTRHDPK